MRYKNSIMPRRKKKLAKQNDDEVVMFEGRTMTKAELLQELAEAELLHEGLRVALEASQYEQLDLLERCGYSSKEEWLQQRDGAADSEEEHGPSLGDHEEEHEECEPLGDLEEQPEVQFFRLEANEEAPPAELPEDIWNENWDLSRFLHLVSAKGTGQMSGYRRGILQTKGASLDYHIEHKIDCECGGECGGQDFDSTLQRALRGPQEENEEEVLHTPPRRATVGLDIETSETMILAGGDAVPPPLTSLESENCGRALPRPPEVCMQENGKGLKSKKKKGIIVSQRVTLGGA